MIYITYDTANQSCNAVSEHGCLFFSKAQDERKYIEVAEWLADNGYVQVSPLVYK